MRDIVLSEDVFPIAEFKKQASRLFRRVQGEKRSILVTQNGRPVGVVVPPEEYDRIRERERLLAAVQEGLRQSEAGQTLSSEQVDAELDRALGALPTAGER
jgi:prevent-host-death family protein